MSKKLREEFRWASRSRFHLLAGTGDHSHLQVEKGNGAALTPKITVKPPVTGQHLPTATHGLEEGESHARCHARRLERLLGFRGRERRASPERAGTSQTARSHAVQISSMR